MKKKLTVLAIMCVILIVLGGINSNVFFGTQYLTTKPGFGYTVSSGVTWWDCNWSYNKKITIDHTKVQSDQDYFPVLIYESSDPDLVAHAQSDGDDILFVDAGQTVQLHHEIEKYNSVTGELSIWVEVAHLLSTSDTVIYMYYGNPDCSSQQNVEGTWNSNYAMVQHLNETSGTHGDSTSNNNDGTIVGGVTQGTSGRSVLDGSDQFSGGIDQYISFGNQSSLTPSSVTLEAWVKDPPIGGAECYDEKTQILTLDGWKYFSDLTDDDVVLTFNQSTGKQEWQRPLDRAVFNHNGTMYRITTEKGDLLVSPKHNVYAWMGNAASFLNMVQDCSSPQMVNSFASDYDRCSDLSVWNTSIVDNIGTLFCSLNATSSDHIGQWYDNANAKYGSSFVSAPCGESACAFDNNALYSSLGIVRISCLSNESKKLNSGSVRFFEYLKIFPFISVSSFNTKSGDISMQSQLSNSSMRYFRAESGLKKEKSIFASTTRRFGSMLQSPCRFATLRFNSSASLSACSSDNFDLEHMSSAMENSSRRTNSLTTFASAGSNRSFNVDGMWTFTTTSAIHKREYQDYLNVMNFDLTPITDVYEKMQPGEPVFFLDANGTPMSVSSIQKESYDGFIYDVDVPNDIVLVRRGDGSAFWSGNSDSPIDHATHQPMLCYTQKEYTGASAQTVAPENEKDGGGSVDWWNPFSVFKIFTTVLFGDKKPEITPLEPAKLVEVDPFIEKTLKQDGNARVIIRFKDKQQNLSQHLVSLEQAGFDTAAEVPSASLVAGMIDESVLSQIQYDSDISGIYLDGEYQAFLNESLPLIQVPQTVQLFNLSGRGIKICLLDTGVNPSLVRYSSGYDFVNDDSDPSDDNGHGTRVAAVIQSIAPEAELIVAKVIGADGTGYESDVLEGLQYCLDQHPDIICFSIGSSGGCPGFCDADFVAELCNQAASEGVFVVAAAGNDGSTNLRSPACGSNVFSVGATTDDDGIAGFSNVNPTLDLFAPGVDITTIAGMSSGTSMSAPHVAGAAALLLEQENLSPDELSYRLRSTGLPIPYVYNESLRINISRLDVYNAITNNKTCEPYDHSLWWQDELGGSEESEYETLGSSTITYYFNSRSNSEIWDTNPDYMVDALVNTYANTTTSADVELCLSNNCSGGTLGKILSVDLRAYAYKTGGGITENIILRPVFRGTTDGDDHSFMPPTGSAAWSSYFNITADTHAPNPWTWTDVNTLDCDVQALTTGWNLFCSMVEIRVTYNAKPYVDTVAINSTHNFTLDDLSGSGSYHDNESDPQSGSKYEWYTNQSGSWAAIGVNSTTLDSNLTNESSWYKFEYTPCDGNSYGTAVNSSAFQVIPLQETAGTYSGVYTESRNLTVTTSGSLTISGTLTCTGNVSVTGTGSLDLGSQSHSLGTLTVGATASCTGSSGTITITSETAGGYAVDLDGSYTNNSGTLNIQTNSDTIVDLIPSSGTVYNLTINLQWIITPLSANWEGSTTIGGSLSIPKGTFRPNSAADQLNVTSDVSISGTGALGGNSASGAWTMKSLNLTAGALVSATTGTITITGENASGYAVDLDGAFSSSGTLEIQTNSATVVDLIPTSGTVYNLIINTQESDCNVNWEGNTTISNTLTITNGLFRPNTLSDNLTVTSAVSISGTGSVLGSQLVIASGAWTMKSLTLASGNTVSATTGTINITGSTAEGGGYAVDLDGTYTSNSGTMRISTDVAAKVDLIPSSGTIYNLLISTNGAQTISWEGNTAITNTLTVTVGTFQPNTATDTLTVSGDVTVNGGRLGGNSASGLWTLKSLTESSGNIGATTGTIAITGETAGGYAVDLDGAFSSSGTLEIQTNSDTIVDLIPSSMTVYTLTINTQGNDYNVNWEGPTTISNTLTISNGVFQPNSSAQSDTLTVTSDVSISGTGSQLGGNSATGAWTMKSLTLTAGNTVSATSGTINITGQTAGLYAVDLDGTYTHNSGTMIISTNAAATVDLITLTSPVIYNLLISTTGGAQTISWEGNTAITNTLTVTVGTFQPNTTTDKLVVGGDVTVNGGRLGGNSASGTWTLKSLTESSGNIDATTGTIIINGETNGGRAVDLDGTYTNNSGTLQIETTEDTTIDIAPASGSLWNLIIDTVGYDVTSGDANSDIDNNLTIINSMLLVSNTHTAHNITIDTNGEFNITSGTTLTTDGTLTLNGHFNITSGTAIGLNLSTTVFDLTHGINIALHTTPNPPADPNGWTNIDKYVNLTSIGASSTVDLNVTYTDADLSGPAEDTLVMYKYNETTATWTQTPGSGVDSTTNHVWADGINSFSDYIPLFSDIPVVVTNASTGVEETNATLQGYLRYDGNESTCTVRFEYGTTTAYGTNTTNQTKSEGQTFSADITSLTKGQLYHYRAYANNTVGSDTGDDSTLLTKPDPPSSLTATAYDNNNVNLTWVNGTGKNTTYIERNTTSSWARGNGTAVYNGTATSYQDTGLTAGMQYYYQAWSFTTWTYDTTTLHQWSDTNASATTNTSAYNKEILNMSRSTYSLEINISGTQLSGYISNTMVNTSIDTDWHYVSLTYDGTTMKLYKDGELKNSTTAGSISYPTQIPSLIAGRSLSGWLDELRISSTSRSASWINTTYQNTNNPETFATFGSETGVLSTWGCRKKITIDHLMTNATLTNFPVLIYNASDTDLKNSAQPTGDDIIFMSTSVDWTTGTWRSKLDHEIEKYDSSTGELVAWVRIPTFSSTTDTEIYMYYNNTLCTTNRENAEGVWDSNYEMVQHLHDEDEIADSTSNGNDGENNGVEFSRLGKIDGAISFHEGASINVETLNDGANYARGDYTLSLWFKTDANSEDLMSDYEDYSGGMGEPYVNGWVLGINKDDFLTYTAYDLASEASIVGDTKVVTIEWVYVVVVDRGETSKTGETTTIYLNGQVEVDGSRGAIGSGGRIFTLGAEHYTDILGQGYRNFFVGLMDEVRISDIARNSSWINASFNNMNSTSYTRSMMRGGDESDESDIFIRFGRQEIQNVAPAQSNPDPKNDATGVDLNPTLTITVDDLNLDVLDVMFYTNSSGSWTPIGSNTSVFDGTYHQTPNSFTSHSTKYYWSVNVTDGLSWTNATYALTTREVIISWCYQETADQDTACGGENNGNYTYSSNWSLLYPGTNGTDGNWSTYSLPDAENIGYVYVNYTKPSGATNASMWLTKSGEDPAQNCTIPQVCWDQDPLSIWCKIEASYPDDTVTWSCYDGASWIPLRQTMGPPKIYEEAIWWYSEI